MAQAVEILGEPGDPGLILNRVRGRAIWMTPEYMPTTDATVALERVQQALILLLDNPPVTPADLAPLRKALAELLALVDDCLRHWLGGKP